MTLAPPYYADAERVAVQWIKTYVAGIDPTKVATTLPEQQLEFIQVRALPTSSPDVDINAKHHSFLTLDFWAASSTSKPQWGTASQLAMRTRAAMGEAQPFGQAVDLGVGFLPIRVQAVYPATEPRRIDGDPGGYARYTFDAFFDWVQG